MRRHIQEIPSDLPNACLYLDDIETVTGILSSAMAEAAAAYMARRRKENSPPVLDGDKLVVQANENLPAVLDGVKVVYRIGQEEMDSIDDLLEQGGSVTNFQVNVVNPRDSWDRCELEFSWTGKPRLRLHAIRQKSKEWEIHAKVREVFEKRRSVIKNFIEDLPYWVKTATWSIVAIGPFIAPGLKGTARLVVDVFVGSVFIVFLLGLAAIMLPNRVYFTRRHAQSRAKSETRNKFLKGAIIFVLGAVVKQFLDYLYAHFVK